MNPSKTLILPLLAAASLCSANAAMIAHWNMNESSGNLADSSGNGLNTTAVNIQGTGLIYNQSSVTAGTYGSITIDAATAASFGTSIDFGTDATNRGNFSLGNPALIGNLVTDGTPPTGSFTIMAWINLDAVTGTQRLLGTGFFSGPSGGWAFGTTGNDLRLTTIGGIDNQLDTNIVAGTWTHIAMTYTNNTWEGFINGVSVGTDSDAGNFIEEVSTDYRIGALPNGNDQFLGRMDELRIFNTALTATQIQAAAVPEPSIALLSGLGLLGLLRRRRA